MRVKVDENAGEITITLPIAPRPSKSGKTTVIATTSGNQTFMDTTFDSKPITLGVNAYVPR